MTKKKERKMFIHVIDDWYIVIDSFGHQLVQPIPTERLKPIHEVKKFSVVKYPTSIEHAIELITRAVMLDKHDKLELNEYVRELKSENQRIIDILTEKGLT